MQKYNEECIVLKSLNYRDSDKLYTLYSKKRGKVTALAKGVRKITSRRGGNLDTLNNVLAGFSEGHSGHKIITEVKTLNSFKKVKSSLDDSLRAYYMAELIHKFIEEGHGGREAEDIHSLMLSTLTKLEEGVKNPLIVVGSFELSLMKILGYKMPVDMQKLAQMGTEQALSLIRAYVRKTLGERIKTLEI